MSYIPFVRNYIAGGAGLCHRPGTQQDFHYHHIVQYFLQIMPIKKTNKKARSTESSASSSNYEGMVKEGAKIP